MLERTPYYSVNDLFVCIADHSEFVKDNALTFQKINEEYLYWDKVKYLARDRGIDSDILWKHVKFERILKRITLWDKYDVDCCITNHMQRLCHFFDMNFGGTIESEGVIPENRERYLLNSLMEEAISSSQMEGASTTRKVAKEMLRKNKRPRSRSEQMILNNYQTIQFIVANKNRDLTPELLSEIHRLMTLNTLDNPEDAGRFRNVADDVWVEDKITHEIMHTPPTADGIPEFIDSLCNFFNNAEQTLFIHPIIRAITIHFMVAYMHPFVDGNGRTARALFYWHMLKNGYWLMEYMPISRIIGRSKKMYETSFLHSEYDGNDIGYFIVYNLRVLEQAFVGLQNYIRKKIQEKRSALDILSIGNINERQAELLRMFAEDETLVLTVKDAQLRFSVSPTTAKSDIKGLVDGGFLIEISFNKVKRGYRRSDSFNDLIAH